MAMPKQKFTLRFITFLLVNLWCKQMVIMAKEIIPVGVVLDLNSTVGEIAESCISMAVSDFYAVNDDFKTRLALFTRDSSRDVVAATSSGFLDCVGFLICLFSAAILICLSRSACKAFRNGTCN
ncbi:hypothetical protein OIU79_002868 [Salix purpurea]|uniref:Uncharacterized protein n=1 Tax=Salix purpurea TaxID=77065 RepID=A0A9Q0UK48_SALPP|nr:hypothetical protein OIU79_002868 [Salix purpurea]